MKKFIMDKETFFTRLSLELEKNYNKSGFVDDVIILFRCGYNTEELENKCEIMYFKDDDYVWLHDWDEGQKYFILDDIINISDAAHSFIERG